MADQTKTPEHQNTHTRTPTPDHQNRTPEQNTRLHHWAALIPWSAALGAAGWYQADLAEQTFGWNYPWAFVFPLAIECGIAWSAGNFHRRLVNRDSAVGARLGFYLITAFSCSLLFWHARSEGRPLASAIGIAAMSVIAAWVITQRASLARREVMRARNLVYPSMPNYPVYRWFLCPIETIRALRFGVKNGLDNPLEALEQMRNQNTRADHQNRAKRKPADHQPEPGPEQPTPNPNQNTKIRPGSKQTPKAEQNPEHQSRPMNVDEMVYTSAIRQHPDWPQTSINQIADLVSGIDPAGTCGKSRAIRLRDRALEGATSNA